MGEDLLHSIMLSTEKQNSDGLMENIKRFVKHVLKTVWNAYSIQT